MSVERFVAATTRQKEDYIMTISQVPSDVKPSRCWKSGPWYEQKKKQNRFPEERMTHAPDAVTVIAGLPVVTISALMQVIAGPHRTYSSTHNAQMCADAVERRGCTLAEAEAVYHWALEVEADLDRVGAGEPAETPWADMLWDYSIGLCTLARTAQFISEMAQGLTGKGGTMMESATELRLIRNYDAYLLSRDVQAFKRLPNGKEHRRTYLKVSSASLIRLARAVNLGNLELSVFDDGWQAGHFIRDMAQGLRGKGGTK